MTAATEAHQDISKGHFSPEGKLSSEPAKTNEPLERKISVAIEVVDTSKDSPTIIVKILKDCGVETKKFAVAKATIDALSKRIGLLAQAELFDLAFHSQKIVQAIIATHKHNWSSVEKQEVGALLQLPIDCIAEKKLSYSLVYDQGVTSYWASSVLKEMARLRADLRAEKDDSYKGPHNRQKHLYLPVDISQEECPLLQTTLAFSAIESIFNQRWHGKVGVESIKISIGEDLFYLPPEVQKGISEILCGLFASVRNSLAHGNGRFTKEQLLLTTKLLNNISYFLQPEDLKNGATDKASAARACLAGHVINRAPKDFIALFNQRKAKNPREGLPLAIAKGAKTLEEVLHKKDPRIHILDEEKIIELVLAANDLLHAIVTPSGAPLSLADTTPSTNLGRRMATMQKIELATTVALKRARLSEKTPRLTREKIKLLMSSEQCQKRLGQTPKQSRVLGDALQSIFMLFRNLPQHNQNFQSDNVGAIVDTFIARLAARSVVSLAACQPVTLPEYGTEDYLTSHPVALQACYSALTCSDWADVSKQAHHIIKNIQSSSVMTMTLKEPLVQQQLRQQAIGLFASCLEQFEEESIFSPPNTKDGALERLAMASTFLAVYLPEEPTPLFEGRYREAYFHYIGSLDCLNVIGKEGGLLSRRQRGEGTYKHQKRTTVTS